MSGAAYGNHDDGEKPNAPSGPEGGDTPNKPDGQDGAAETQDSTTPEKYPDSDGGKPDYGSPKRRKS